MARPLPSGVAPAGEQVLLPAFKYLRKLSGDRQFLAGSGGEAVQIQQDKKGQPMIEWRQAGGFKRAWIQRKTDPSKDWAGTGRYLNVVRVEGLGVGIAGQATDFPIFSDLPDEQILEAFVASVCAITGCPLP